MKIKGLLENKTPFAIMQYFTFASAITEYAQKEYELLYVEEKEKVFLLEGTKLGKKDIEFFKENISNFDIVLITNNGKIFEYNNFKKHKETLIPKKIKNQKNQNKEKLKIGDLVSWNNKKWKIIFINEDESVKLKKFSSIKHYTKVVDNVPMDEIKF